jgi:hypothetical protein
LVAGAVRGEQQPSAEVEAPGSGAVGLAASSFAVALLLDPPLMEVLQAPIPLPKVILYFSFAFLVFLGLNFAFKLGKVQTSKVMEIVVYRLFFEYAVRR